MIEAMIDDQHHPTNSSESIDEAPRLQMEPEERNGSLRIDELSIILGFLPWKEILGARVCKLWQEAAKVTSVPTTSSESTTRICSSNPVLTLRTEEDLRALGWIIEALPRLGELAIASVPVTSGPSFSFSFWSLRNVDLSPLVRFRDLRVLSLDGILFNGPYPFIFDFPCLSVVSGMFCNVSCHNWTRFHPLLLKVLSDILSFKSFLI